MADDRLPEHYQSRTPARGVSNAPVHQATELRFGGSTATREQLWQRLSPAVQQKAQEKVGQLLQWWASEDEEGRVGAAALGTQALVVLTPVQNRRGGPATEISTIRLIESSFRSARISAPSEPAPAPTPRTPGSDVATAMTTIDEGMSGFLGQLPSRAQHLLQDPFLNGTRELRYDHFYYRTGNPHSVGGASLAVWCYFTDLQVVTFCAGHGQGYREPSGPKSWDLTCWRADVRR